MSKELSDYIEPIYRFCLKRLSSRADAEDLSQEILLCVLQAIKRGGINNLDGYIWRIAHNRYARLIQKRNGEPAFLYGQEYYIDIPDTEPDIEPTEAHQTVFNALHTLSAMYRDIMVDYYLHRIDTYMIAQKYGISVETVKWRLHAGREKIRERITHMEKNYEHIKMHVMFNGRYSPDPHQYLVLQLQKAISKVCYKSPLTIEEISLATGVPTLYMADVLQNMQWGGAMEQIGSKYATNFIITPTGKEMDALLSNDLLRQATETILEYVQSTETQIREIGFYGSDFPMCQLMHIAVPAIVYQFGNNNAHQQFPLLKNGNAGWFIVHDGIETLDWRFAEMQGYHYDPNVRPGHWGIRFNQFWVGDTFSSDLHKLLKGNAGFYLTAIGKDYVLSFEHEEDAAKALSHNLCYKHSSGLMMPSIAIFTEKEYSTLLAWARKCGGFDAVWQKWVDVLRKAYKTFTPKRLVDQIDGNINYHAFNLYPHVIKELQNRGFAAAASDSEIFTYNLFLVR